MTDFRQNASPTGDTFIHYLFASPGNERILLSFVNAVLDNAGRPPVMKTEVRNPFNPKTFVTDKSSIIDIKAVADNNHSFVIEFQVLAHKAFANRMLYYWARTYAGQIRHSEEYEKLNPVISIIVTRFLMFPELEKLHNTFWITAQDVPEVPLTDNLQIYTLELVAEKLGQLPAMKEPLRQWLEFFQYSDTKSEEEMRFLLENSDPVVRDAYDEYRRFNQSEELRMLEENREKSQLDFNSYIGDARREGEAKGKAEGIVEGEAKGKVKGKAEGKAETLLKILTKRFSSVPEPLEARICAITDPAYLDKLIDFVLDCESLEAFSEALR